MTGQGAEQSLPRRPRTGRSRRKPALPPWMATTAVAVVFALLYGWDLFEAVAALVALLDFASAAGRPLNSYAWLVLGTGILVPPVTYATALLVGRGRGPLLLAAVLAVGLTASAAVGLTIEALLRA